MSEGHELLEAYVITKSASADGLSAVLPELPELAHGELLAFYALKDGKLSEEPIAFVHTTDDGGNVLLKDADGLALVKLTMAERTLYAHAETNEDGTAWIEIELSGMLPADAELHVELEPVETAPVADEPIGETDGEAEEADAGDGLDTLYKMKLSVIAADGSEFAPLPDQPLTVALRDSVITKAAEAGDLFLIELGERESENFALLLPENISFENDALHFEAAIIGETAIRVLRHAEPEADPETDPDATDPIELDPTETDPTETDPTETDPAETDPTETGTSDPVELDPTETDPTETDPTETDPEETDPAETDPTETDPAEGGATGPIELNPIETDPTDKTDDTDKTVDAPEVSGPQKAPAADGKSAVPETDSDDAVPEEEDGYLVIGNSDVAEDDEVLAPLEGGLTLLAPGTIKPIGGSADINGGKTVNDGPTSGGTVVSVDSKSRKVESVSTEFLHLTAYGAKNAWVRIAYTELLTQEGWEVLEAYTFTQWQNKAQGLTVGMNMLPELLPGELLALYGIRDGVLDETPVQIGINAATEPYTFFRGDCDGFALVVLTTLEQTMEIELPASDDDAPAATLTLDGVLPAGARVAASAVPTLAPAAETLKNVLVYDISIFSLDDSEFEPQEDAPITVTIRSDAIRALIEGGQPVYVYHYNADGVPVLVENVTLEGDCVSFDAYGFSAYAVTTTIEKIITATDGNTYKITVTFTDETGIPADADLDVRELLESDEDYAAYKTQSLALLGAKKDAFMKLFDIRIVKKTDPTVRYQPAEGALVDVSIQLLDPEKNYKTLGVVHFGDEPQRMTATTTGGDTVVFQTGGFSVYAIVDHEGGAVNVPRVEFHFIAPVAEDYEPSVLANVAYYTSTPYEFFNKSTDQANNKQTTLILRDGDKIDAIESPMNTTSTYFYGWYTVKLKADGGVSGGNITYYWPDDTKRVELDQIVSIVAEKDANGKVTKITWTVNGITGTTDEVNAVIDNDGCAHIYLAPIYSNYHFVNFHLGGRDETTTRENVMARKLAVLGNSNQTEVRVSDITAPSTDPQHVIFVGWERYIGPKNGTDADYANVHNWESVIRTIDENGNEINEPGKVGTYFLVKAEYFDENRPNIDLFPVFVQARWINFDIGAAGNGALYLGPQFMYTSDFANGTEDDFPLAKLPVTTRYGYTFGGWFTEADGAGVQITDASGNILTGITVTARVHNTDDGAGHITQTLTYDNIPATAAEIANGEIGFTIVNGQLRVYEALEDATLHAKWTASASASYKVIIWKQKASDAADIADDAKTYDYETYYYNDAWNTSNPVTTAVLSSFAGKNASGSPVSNENLLGKSFTGFKLGRYDSNVTVDPQGSTVINIYYDRITYDLKFVFAKRYQSVSETATLYVPVLNGTYRPPNTITWQAYVTQGTGMNWDTAATSDLSEICTYPAASIQHDDYNSERYYFYVIRANYGAEISDLWPEYAKFPAANPNGNTNTRRLSGWWMMASADLYGSAGQNDTVKGVVSTIDEDILGDVSSSDGNFLIASYRISTPNDWTYNIYLQVLAGVDYTGKTTETRPNGITYYLASSFIARSSNNQLNQQNAPSYAGFDNTDRVSGGNLVANFYYSRKSYNLSFNANYPPALSGLQPADVVFENIPYQTSLASYASTPAPALPNSNYYFAGWFEDASGTVEYSFAGATMPSANKIIYAKWSLIEYPIHIIPNGGIIDHINYTGNNNSLINDPTELQGYAALLADTGLTRATYNGYATYFDNEATQTISEYGNIVRPFVEVDELNAEPGEALYRYVYTYHSGMEQGKDGKLAADARNAVYVLDNDESLEAYYNYYVEEIRLRNAAKNDTLVPLAYSVWLGTYVSSEKYRALRPGESYELLGWYEMIGGPNGTMASTTFDFSKPAEKETWLIAQWRLNGGYTLQYTPDYYADNNDYVTGNIQAFLDPSDGGKYADGATTQAMHEPTAIMVNGVLSDAYQFRGWQIVRVSQVGGRDVYTPLEPGVYYLAGQPLTVRAKFSDPNMIIHMQAVYERRETAYRRPEVVNLTLDASKDARDTGTFSVDLSRGGGHLPNWTYPGSHYATGTQILFGDAQSNAAVHLYKYATTLTESEITGETLNPAGINYFVHTDGYKLIGFDADAPDTDFIPDFAADAVVAVSPGDSHTLYAVWEPMVYLDVVNTTNQPLFIKLTSTSTEALRVVNQANGSFSREPVDPNGITVQPGTTRFVLPYGEGENFTLSGTNTLGTGWEMTVTSTYAGRDSSQDPAQITKIKNTQPYSISDQFYEDTTERAVTVTLSALKMPRTLILHDNDEVDAVWETSFDISEPSYTLTQTRVRVGREFQGWDPDPNATTATYPIDSSGNMNQTLDLNAFFGIESEKHLYAVWGTSDKEALVKVFKYVPAPGNQDKSFTFTVRVQGQYRRYNSGGYTQIDNSQTFTLSHGQYLTIQMYRNLGGNGNRATLRVGVQKYNADDTAVGGIVYVGWQNTNNNGYNTVNLTSVTITEAPDDNYTTSTEIAGLYNNSWPITPAGTTNPNNTISWTNDRTGGTVIFTNTRKTADLTVKKTLLPAGQTAKTFDYTVEIMNGSDSTHYESYTLPQTAYSALSGGEGFKIEDIPTGAILKITETADDSLYSTNATASPAGGTFNVAERSYTLTLGADTTVTFTNTLEKQKIRIVLTDDSNPAVPLTSGQFTFTDVTDFGTGLSNQGGTAGLVWEGEVLVGNHVLTQTQMYNHQYQKLAAPVTVSVTRTAVTVPAGTKNVTVTEEGTGENHVWIVTVVNPQLAKVTVKKVVNDFDTTGTFGFTITLTDSEGHPLQQPNVNGSSGTDANGQLFFLLQHEQSVELYVPKDARLTIAETPDEAFVPLYRTGADADHLGALQGGGTAALAPVTADTFVLFTNERSLPSPTGVTFTAAPYFILFAFGIALVIPAKIVTRSRGKGAVDD